MANTGRSIYDGNGKEETKICPRCGNEVSADKDECNCGYKFVTANDFSFDTSEGPIEINLDELFGDSFDAEPQINIATSDDTVTNTTDNSTAKTTSVKKTSTSTKSSSTKKTSTSKKKQSAPATENEDKFSYVPTQESNATTYETVEAINVYGVGLYSSKYKFFVSLFMIILAAAIGAVSVIVCYVLNLSNVLNYTFMKYIVNYIPLFNVAVMLIYYIIFAVRGYNYRKHGAASIPSTENKTYRKMHSMYYTTKRAIFLLVLLFLLNASFVATTNFLYEVMSSWIGK